MCPKRLLCACPLLLWQGRLASGVGDTLVALAHPGLGHEPDLAQPISCIPCAAHRIVRAFLIEEQKIVKKVGGCGWLFLNYRAGSRTCRAWVRSVPRLLSLPAFDVADMPVLAHGLTGAKAAEGQGAFQQVISCALTPCNDVTVSAT